MEEWEAELRAKLQGKDSKKVEFLVGLARELRDAFREFANAQGCSVADAALVAADMKDIRTAGTKSAWGPLPTDYHPDTDPAHPGRAKR